MKPNPFTTISHEVKMTAAEKAAMKSRLLTVMRGGTIERSHHTQSQSVTEQTQTTQPAQPAQPAQPVQPITVQSVQAQPAVAPVDTVAPTPSPITVTKSFWKTTDFKLATTAAALAMCTLFVVFFSDSIVTGITAPRAKTPDPDAESDMVAPMMATVETAPSLAKMAELETTPVTTTPQPITRKVATADSVATTTVATGTSAIRMMPTTTTPAVMSNYAAASPAVAGSYSIAQTTTVIPSFDVSAYSQKVDLLEGWNDSICADPKKETLCKQVQNTIYTIRKLLIDTTYADDPDLAQAKQLILQLEKNTSFISPADLAKLYL